MENSVGLIRAITATGISAYGITKKGDGLLEGVGHISMMSRKPLKSRPLELLFNCNLIVPTLPVVAHIALWMSSLQAHQAHRNQVHRF